MYDPMGLWAWDDDWVETIIDVVTQREVAKNFLQGASDGFLVTTNAAVQVVTIGMAGYSQHQLDAMGMLYDAENPQLAASRYAGYTAGGALLAASLLSGAQAAGMPTMHVSVGRTVNGNTHVVYGSEGKLVHAWGATGAGLLIRERAASTSLSKVWFTIAGIPVRNDVAVTQTGGTATNCATAAWRGFVKGWLGP
jgi:hypothetical protein